MTVWYYRQVPSCVSTTKADLVSLKIELKAKLANVKADLLKWSVPLLLGQAALIIALIMLL